MGHSKNPFKAAFRTLKHHAFESGGRLADAIIDLLKYRDPEVKPFYVKGLYFRLTEYCREEGWLKEWKVKDET